MKLCSLSQKFKRINKNPIIWVSVKMTNILCHGGKGSNERNKKHEEFSPFPEAHIPDVLIFFPLLLSALRKKKIG